MDDLLDLELIINRQKYPFIYHMSFILFSLIIIFIYVIFTYSYQSYYVIKGKFTNNQLEILVNVDDIKYVINNDVLFIDNIPFKYHLSEISDKLYVSDDYINYQYLYLEIQNQFNIDNYVCEVKIIKEKQKLVNYLKEYL